MSPTMQRGVGIAVLVIAGILSLPLAAALLDGPRTENWVIPAQLVVMAAIGAAVCLALPAMVKADSSTGVRVLTGVGWGILAAIAGLMVFWLLLNGFSGA